LTLNGKAARVLAGLTAAQLNAAIQALLGIVQQGKDAQKVAVSRELRHWLALDWVYPRAQTQRPGIWADKVEL
jgi:hypothetical protein